MQYFWHSCRLQWNCSESRALQVSMDLDTTRKRPRESGVAVDRLSALPDCLLHVIMSFMKARQVVQTCMLSKRWEHLWRTVPCLDVDHREFQSTGEAAQGDNEVWQNFEDFADNLMLHHQIAHLDTFQLHVNNVYRWGQHASRWIRRSIKYNTKVPGIPRPGLSCSSWSLKRLHLSNICLDDLFAKHISSMCCSLEDLNLKGCRFAFNEITSHSLKSLVIDSCDSKLCPSKLVVTAPAIASLCLIVKLWFFPGGLIVNEMPFLSKASILVSATYDGKNFQHNQSKFLGSLCNVTTLELSGFQTMVCILSSQTCFFYTFTLWCHFSIIYFRLYLRNRLSYQNSRTSRSYPLTSVILVTTSSY